MELTVAVSLAPDRFRRRLLTNIHRTTPKSMTRCRRHAIVASSRQRGEKRMSANGPNDDWPRAVIEFLRESLPVDSRSPLRWSDDSMTAYQLGCDALVALGQAERFGPGALAKDCPRLPETLPRWDDICVTVLGLADVTFLHPGAPTPPGDINRVVQFQMRVSLPTRQRTRHRLARTFCRCSPASVLRRMDNGHSLQRRSTGEMGTVGSPHTFMTFALWKRSKLPARRCLMTSTTKWTAS